MSDPDAPQAGPSVSVIVRAAAVPPLRLLLAEVLAVSSGDGAGSPGGIWLREPGDRHSVGLGRGSRLAPARDAPWFIDVNAIAAERRGGIAQLQFRRARTRHEWLPWLSPRASVELARALLARLDDAGRKDPPAPGR
jgi:hypothetical protein